MQLSVKKDGKMVLTIQLLDVNSPLTAEQQSPKQMAIWIIYKRKKIVYNNPVSVLVWFSDDPSQVLAHILSHGSDPKFQPFTCSVFG